MAKKLTTEEFVTKARSVHGDKYSYTQVDYKSSQEKVRIVCNLHGEFKQMPNNHLQGSGCPKCGDELIGAALRGTQEEFLEKCKAVHAGRYDYSKVDYKNSREKVEIGCPSHGSFWQRPRSHLWGSGCPKCGDERIGAVSRKTQEEFLEECKAVHGDTYDYTQVEYKGIKAKVKILCPSHGEFEQTPDGHLQGKGCLK